MLSFLTAPAGAGPLALTRVLIGLAALIKGATFLPQLLGLSHANTLVVPVFTWMPEPSQALLVVISVIWLMASGMFMLGWQVHLSGSILAATLAFTLLLDQQTYSNHLFLMAVLVALATLADAGAALPFPRGSPTRNVPLWGPLLIMSQVSVVYLFAAATKINRGFLSGQVILDTMTDGVISPPSLLTTPGAGRTLAVLTIATELFLAIGLWIRATRIPAVLVGAALHGSTMLFLGPIAELFVFTLLMTSAYPLYFLLANLTKRDVDPQV